MHHCHSRHELKVQCIGKFFSGPVLWPSAVLTLYTHGTRKVDESTAAFNMLPSCLHMAAAPMDRKVKAALKLDSYSTTSL